MDSPIVRLSGADDWEPCLDAVIEGSSNEAAEEHYGESVGNVFSEGSNETKGEGSCCCSYAIRRE